MTLKTILTCTLFTLLVPPTAAQTGETAASNTQENWAVSGLLCLSYIGDLNDDTRPSVCYNPPVPMLMLGSSWLNGGIKGDRQAQFPLRSGVFRKLAGGFTLLQVSRNLYRGIFGVSAGLQVGGYSYDVAPGYSAEKNGHRVEFVPADNEHKNDKLSFIMFRMPLMIGAHDRNRLFSLQTGLGLCYTSRPGAQWMLTAGVGPVTFNYSQNLTPLFKSGDGTNAYPSSFTIGLDILYLLTR